jgi:hypothetical protein
VLNPDAMTLWHRHGDEWAEMSEEPPQGPEPHGPDAHDPERAMLRGARVFRCSSCSEEVRVTGAPPA